MNALERLKQLQAEVGDAISGIEAEERGTGTPTPTNYSSSVSSVEVDPTTGNITVSLTLYPGDTPITPPPVAVPPDEAVPVPPVPPVEPEREAPPVGAEGASTVVTPHDENATEPPPGFVPAE